MSRPPIPFKPADGPYEIDPARRTPSPAPADRPYTQISPELLAIQDIMGTEDALEAFDAESEAPVAKTRPLRTSRLAGFALAAAAAAVAGLMAVLILKRPPPAASAMPPAGVGVPAGTGLAQFDSRPDGAEVVIDGVARGKTPLKLSLPVGSHTLEIRNDAGTRSLPLSIEAGTLVSQYVELLGAGDRAPGRLDVTSDPPGAQVKIDGVVKGVTPLIVDAVDPGEHNVSLSRNGVTILRTVRVTPGTTGSVMATLSAAAAGAIGGWIALRAPIELQVFEDGQLLGSTSAERLMVPAGRHRLELVNAPFQFRSLLSVDVQAGKVATPVVTMPNGTLSVNALPWAEVSIDGRPAGTTPLANLAVPIGTHELVLRHPQMGEQRRTVTVTTQAPARVGVDFAQ